MNTRHTPKPWKEGTYNSKGIELPEKARRIFMPGNSAAWVTGENQEANASLIAAAPELLEALEAMVMFAESPDFDGAPSDAAVSAARAVIAKATGGSK